MCRRFLSVSLCVVVLLALSASTALADLARPMPWLNGVTTESVYVCVEANNGNDATVDFGQTMSYGSSVTTAYTQTTGGSGGGPSNSVHNIKLTGLLPNTEYHYRVTQGSSITSDYAFWTAPLPGTPAKWGFAADSRTNITDHNNMVPLIAGHNPRMMVYGGDLVDEWMYASWNSEWFVSNQNDLNATTPWVNAVGNHERGEITFNEPMAFTQAPDRDGDDPSGDRRWFSFDYGDTHILVLNTQLDHSQGSDQWNFVAADLATNNSQFTIVAMHVSPYVAGGHDGLNERQDLMNMTTQLFYPNGVDLTMSGHSHFYQHNYVDEDTEDEQTGIHHMVLGSFGAPMYAPGSDTFTIYSEETYNYGIIETTETTLTLTTYRGFENTVIETIVLTKDPPTALPGDVNGDGWVGGADLTMVITNWGKGSATREEGDLSGDATVAGADYTEVITNWGTGTPLPPPEQGTIPEPATLGLLLVGALAGLICQR